MLVFWEKNKFLIRFFYVFVVADKLLNLAIITRTWLEGFSFLENGIPIHVLIDPSQPRALTGEEFSPWSERGNRNRSSQNYSARLNSLFPNRLWRLYSC